MSELAQDFSASLKQHQAVFDALDKLYPNIQTLVEQCYMALLNGGKLIFFGNGGSAADAQHLAAEFVVRYKRERRALASIALTTDTSILTAGGNDYGYDQVFSRQIEALCKPEDVVIGITTSGKSPNINLALAAANEIGAYTVSFTGRDGGLVKDIAKLNLIVPSDVTAHIQEAHIFIGHFLCDAIDKIVSQED
ncbi:D-sedoheptulose 7-phosphate isomerase [Catenovulum sp. SM1970]|uniref:D-sedoheptulose 7-phosphate isomerase n=1 Tax=Marinifaba aquimaris TaxID=2741323 RepID=UPI0015727778|nr:D-sedoheptulose 7-phosphate isomerase [Marinifaba aquimaris]NTS75717.1 D-sedoheptulose 7-phosphate isomerase [Marinifaba aquimaris]